MENEATAVIDGIRVPISAALDKSMSLNLHSRFLKICFVSASLLFILWLSSALWLDALEHRQDARRVQNSSAQEEILFKLANNVSQQRHLFYALYTNLEPSQAAINRLRTMVNSNYAIALENKDISIAKTSSESHHQHSLTKNNSGNGHSSMHTTVPEVQITETETPPTLHTNTDDKSKPLADKNNSHSHHRSTGTIAHTFSLRTISQQLMTDKEYITTQLNLPRDLRAPDFGMQKFHDYSIIIESLDNIKKSLQFIPLDGKREFYTHTKLKDSIWNLREALQQISTLMEGIVALSGISDDMAQTRHYADMLMELNIRVNLAWNELLKISNATDNNTLKNNALQTAMWYSNSFKSLSTRLSASTRYNSITLGELREWIGLTEQFLRQTEAIHADAQMITLASVKHVEHRATLNLILVSILLLFAIGMAIATLFFFKRADKQAHQDDLTGLDNRRMFGINLNKNIAAAKNTNTVLGMLMIDLDKFKYINDTMGHAAGDSLLQKVSIRIVDLANDNRVARLGGDEFAILLPQADMTELHLLARTISKELIKPFNIDGATINIGSSIGIAVFPRDAETDDLLIHAADLAMYSAKKSGTNKIIEYDSDLDQSMASSARLITEIKTAIELEQFELYYQPQFNLALHQVESVEALIRWNHPERGFVSPLDFIPAAEENGLMPAIGNWVIDEACRQSAEWLHKDKSPLRVAVNISADHFFQADFVQSIMDSLEKHKLPPQYLEMEVTESVAVNDMDSVVKLLAALRASSIQVALDDFGTGYSSLSYLQDLPLDTLKIDKSFIQKLLLDNSKHDSITETIVALGKSLSLATVAEGVETADQLTAVSDMQISVVQGYYYSKPVAANELQAVVRLINETNHIKKAA